MSEQDGHHDHYERDREGGGERDENRYEDEQEQPTDHLPSDQRAIYHLTNRLATIRPTGYLPTDQDGDQDHDHAPDQVWKEEEHPPGRLSVAPFNAGWRGRCFIIIIIIAITIIVIVIICTQPSPTLSPTEPMPRGLLTLWIGLQDIYTHTHTHTHIYIYIYIYISTYVYVHIYIHTRTHTRIYVYIHIYILVEPSLLSQE